MLFRSLDTTPIPLQLPVGTEENFKGVVDLIKMKEIIWNEGDKGMTFVYAEIPADLQAACEEQREILVEAAAEANEDLMEKYLSGEGLSEEEIIAGLRHRTINNEIVPVVCGSSFKNKGVQAMLDKVIELLPSPIDIDAIQGINPTTDTVDSRAADDDVPFAALAFKIATDPFVGTLTFVQ